MVCKLCLHYIFHVTEAFTGVILPQHLGFLAYFSSLSQVITQLGRKESQGGSSRISLRVMQSLLPLVAKIWTLQATVCGSFTLDGNTTGQGPNGGKEIIQNAADQKSPVPAFETEPQVEKYRCMRTYTQAPISTPHSGNSDVRCLSCQTGCASGAEQHVPHFTTKQGCWHKMCEGWCRFS